MIQGPLTTEIASKDSAVRQFFDDRLGTHLREVQATYRAGRGPILVPGVSADLANAGTIGTAADWLMRFLACPVPSLHLAMFGAEVMDLRAGLRDLAHMLGYRDAGTETFTGPGKGSGAEPGLLYRACWVLALLTEVYRRPDAAMAGPLGGLRRRSAGQLLDAVPSAALDQLDQLRLVMESSLIPALSSRRGLWAIGPVFAGSEIMNGDADLVAGGVLVELKTTVKPPSLGVTDLWQLLGYALMDYTDEFGISEVALFSARYGYLAQWPLDELLTSLAGRDLSAAGLRAEFSELLARCAP